MLFHSHQCFSFQDDAQLLLVSDTPLKAGRVVDGFLSLFFCDALAVIGVPKI